MTSIIFAHGIENAYTVEILSLSKAVTRGVQVCNFIKKETLAQVFSVNFEKFLRTRSLTEQLRWLLLFYGDREKVLNSGKVD